MHMYKSLISLALAVGVVGTPATAQTLPKWGEPFTSEGPLGFSQSSSEDDVLPEDIFDGPGPAPVPIDGGLGLLGAAGAAYALNRLRKRRDQGETTE